MRSLDRDQVFLTSADGVPLDRPFSRSWAVDNGVPDRLLAAWTRSGLLSHPVQGVYCAAQCADDLQLRLDCLALVVPEDAVVTDNSAAWLWGAQRALAPGDHLVVPRISIFRASPGYRLRNDLTQSGERTFLPGEVVDLGGIRVTSKLRTTCDVGRGRWRDRAFADMDQMMAVADFTRDVLVAKANSPRFRGYRRVRQLRALAPHVDARAQSPGESVLRLRWIDCEDLPYPTPQIPAEGPRGAVYLDLGVAELRYGAEFFGEEFHGPDQQEHDDERLDWLSRRGRWIIDVFRKDDLFGPLADVEQRLRAGVAAARQRYGSLSWSGQPRAGGPR